MFIDNKKRMNDKTLKALVKVIMKSTDKPINFSFADFSNNVAITKNAIYEFITKSVLFKYYIQVLNLEGTNVNDKTIDKMCKIPGYLALRRINLFKCPLITQASLITILRSENLSGKAI